MQKFNGIFQYLKTVPRDIFLGYANCACYALWFGIYVLYGPALLYIGEIVFVAVFALLLLQAVLTIVLAYRLVRYRPRLRRVLPLILVLSCLVGRIAIDLDDLHIVARVYFAGGPDKLSAWSQKLMQAQLNEKVEGWLDELPNVPPSIRRYLSGRVWADDKVVRIELGGGHFHYGVGVCRPEAAPQPVWWQRRMNWPPEVFIGHEQ